MKPLFFTSFLTIAIIVVLKGVIFVSDENPKETTTQKALNETEERSTAMRFPLKKSKAQLALVIGNDDYEYGKLTNPVNDAVAVAQTLTKKGFEVILKTNLTFGEMTQEILNFGERLKKNKGVGLFYFSGHGAQIKGENYLIPTNNYRINDEIGIQNYTVSLREIEQRMENAKNGLNIIILDACRNDPFRWKVPSRSLNRGLAKPDTADGILIAFATHPGATASDNNNENNGLYTKYLLQSMQTPRLTIESMFKRVRAAVEKASEGKQKPWYNASLTGEFCFGGCSFSNDIEDLLQKCQAYFDTHHLTIGYDGTALDCYKKVLKKYPSNAQALAGLEKIEARYVTWIESLLKKGLLDKAKQYLENLRKVNSQSPKLAELEIRILQNAKKPSFPKSTNILIFNACGLKSAHKTLAKFMRINFPNVKINSQSNWLGRSQMEKTMVYYLSENYKQFAVKLGEWFPGKQYIIDYNDQYSTDYADNYPSSMSGFNKKRNLVIFLGNDYQEVFSGFK